MSPVIFVGYHGKYWTLRCHFRRRNFSHLPVFHQYGWHAVRGTRAVSPGRVVFRTYPKRRPGQPGLHPCRSEKDWHPEDRVLFWRGPKGLPTRGLH